MSLSSSTRSPAPNARGKGRPVGGGTNRLPSNRERRPALAALAVILILLGAAGSALIAVSSGNRESFVVVKKDLSPGYQITANDLTSADLAGQTGDLVKWSERNTVINKFTTGWVYKGQFVGKNNITDISPIPTSGAQVGVVLEAGRAPSDGIDAGDIVSVVRVPTGNQDSAVASTIVSAAYVMQSEGSIVPKDKSTVDKLNVTILVPIGKATTVAAAASAKTLVLVKLAPGTKPDVPRSNGGG